MVLCRVIMGNMEVVHPGSTQCYPSGEGFDNGVDDLQNPTRYVVWTMNMNTHIYPEYVISFKVTLKPEGDVLFLKSFLLIRWSSILLTLIVWNVPIMLWVICRMEHQKLILMSGYHLHSFSLSWMKRVLKLMF